MISTGGSRCVDGSDGCVQVEAGSSIGPNTSRDRTTRAMHAGNLKNVYNTNNFNLTSFLSFGSGVTVGYWDGLKRGELSNPRRIRGPRASLFVLELVFCHQLIVTNFCWLLVHFEPLLTVW